MFIVIKSEHYDCTNLICKKDTLEEAVAAVKDSMAQRINKNYHAGLTGTDITHENEDHYGFSFTFDENRNADSSEPRAYSTYDYWNGDDQESVEWVVYEVTTDKPFFLLSYEEYESIELTGFYDSFDEAFEEMKELIAESVNDVFDEDATPMMLRIWKTTMSSYTLTRTAKTTVRRSPSQASATIIQTASGLFSISKI